MPESETTATDSNHRTVGGTWQFVLPLISLFSCHGRTQECWKVRCFIAFYLSLPPTVVLAIILLLSLALPCDVQTHARAMMPTPEGSKALGE